MPIVGGDFDQEALAKVLDHVALNQAAASLYRNRFDSTPGVVYAAGVEHAYNLAQEFRATGLKAEAVSGRYAAGPGLPRSSPRTRVGEIDVLVNAMLLAEGWNSPRATVVMHLAPTASRARLPAENRPDHAPSSPQGSWGRRRLRPEGRDGTDRVVTLHSLLGADFYGRVHASPLHRGDVSSAVHGAGSHPRHGWCQSQTRRHSAGSP